MSYSSTPYLLVFGSSFDVIVVVLIYLSVWRAHFMLD